MYEEHSRTTVLTDRHFGVGWRCCFYSGLQKAKPFANRAFEQVSTSAGQLLAEMLRACNEVHPLCKLLYRPYQDANTFFWKIRLASPFPYVLMR